MYTYARTTRYVVCLVAERTVEQPIGCPNQRISDAPIKEHFGLWEEENNKEAQMRAKGRRQAKAFIGQEIFDKWNATAER